MPIYCTDIPPVTTNVYLSGMGACVGPAQSINLPLYQHNVVPFFCYDLPPITDCSTLSSIDKMKYYNEYIYRDTVTVPVAMQGCPLRIYYKTCCRSHIFTNVVNSSLTAVYTEAIIVDPSVCNRSAYSIDLPVDYLEAGKPYHVANMMFDPDGDSLVYSLAPCLLDSNVSDVFAAGLSTSQPFYTTPANSIGFDPVTGNLSFTPRINMVQYSLFDIVVEEYRNGQLIGINRRTYYPIVTNIVTGQINSIPQLVDVTRFNGTAWHSQGTDTNFEVCPGENVTFRLEFLDDDVTDTVSLDNLYNSLAMVYPSATITSTQPTSNRLILEIQIPAVRYEGFQFSISDSKCLPGGIQSYGIGFTPRAACGRIWGYVFNDGNNNCLLDGSETRLNEALVTLTKGGLTQSTTTLASGFYNFMVADTGTYTITVQQGAPYRTLCTSAQTVLHPNPTTIAQHNLPTEVTTLCPLLNVNIGSAQLVACANNQYTINYCNRGTLAAAQASITVTLNSLFVVDSSSIPWTSQNSSTYTFNLDTLAAASCGNFVIYGRLDTACTTLLGQSFCAQAHIYPDTLCNAWTAARLVVEGRCHNDSVAFRIINIGQQALTTARPYRVLENNSLIFNSSPLSLAAGATTPWMNYPAIGATYRLEIDQEAGYPWGLQASATLEGCQDSAHATTALQTGFVNIFSLDDGAPYQAIDCQASSTGFHSNDKQAFPIGYSNAHYIQPNEDLTYRIRFQNTGTTPVQNLLVIDTLSPFLDAMTVLPNAASHAYTWRVRESRILEITFPNIALPSNASGFVDFAVQQQPNNPLGSVINNEATIYWDGQAALTTNSTFHTIDENFLIFTPLTDLTVDKEWRVTVAPNPFEQSTTLHIHRELPYETLQLMVYNSLGQLVQQVRNQDGTATLTVQRQGLPAGIYFYRLTGDGIFLQTGQLIAR